MEDSLEERHRLSLYSADVGTVPVFNWEIGAFRVRDYGKRSFQ